MSDNAEKIYRAALDEVLDVENVSYDIQEEVHFSRTLLKVVISHPGYIYIDTGERRRFNFLTDRKFALRGNHESFRDYIAQCIYDGDGGIFLSDKYLAKAARSSSLHEANKKMFEDKEEESVNE